MGPTPTTYFECAFKGFFQNCIHHMRNILWSVNKIQTTVSMDLQNVCVYQCKV